MTDDLRRGSDPAKTTRLRELFLEHGFRPRRELGQTFLVDGNIVRKIVRAAELTGAEAVVEVGAGAGAVTRELARHARRVIAIEVDGTLIEILRETVGEAAELVHADVLTVRWEELLATEDEGRWRVVANLPYAITGPAILRLLEARDWVERLVIMVQQEVAERLVAAPGGRARGMLSVLVQATCEAKLVGSVSRTCFWPRPRVDSAILTLMVRRPQLVCVSLQPFFRQVVKAAFGTRRKILANALGHARKLELSKEQAVALLSACGIDRQRRAESLSVEEFLRLTGALARRRQKGSE